MPVMTRGLLIALVAVVIFVVGVLAWAVSVNNQLVVAEQNVNEKWAQVQNVYQRRADLVPNLVETVKGFAAQERTVLEEVTKARASATAMKLPPQALGDPQALERFQAAQNQLGGALGRPLVLPPAPSARVNDYARLLAADARGRLEAKLAGYERATGTQMAIAIFPALEGESLEDVASRLFQSWRLGAKGLDNGVLLVVFV